MQKVKHMLTKENTSLNATYPVYSSESSNNGIIGYTDKPEFICNKRTPIFVTFGDHTRTFNIAKKSFSVLDNVKVLLPFTDNARILLFVISVWQKKIPQLGYSRHWKEAKNCTILLPQTPSGKIDVGFMEDFVRELEESRLRELKAYLLATGLSDYSLSPAEEKTLKHLPQIHWKEFPIKDVFDVKNTHNILLSEIVENPGTTPYLCASAENNSVSSYISYKEQLLERGKCVFIGGKTFVVSYQQMDFFSNDSHNLALYPKHIVPSRENLLYLVTCVFKSLKYKYSWGDSVSKTKILGDTITLPVSKKGLADLTTAVTLIRAVQKLVIKDVVDYTERRLTAAKRIIDKQ